MLQPPSAQLTNKPQWGLIFFKVATEFFFQFNWPMDFVPSPTISRDLGGFHLHLLVFPFVCQFSYRIGVLVHSFASSEGFQQHFSIISKFVYCGFYIKKNVTFTLISFTLLKWDDCLSVQLQFEFRYWFSCF